MMVVVRKRYSSALSEELETLAHIHLGRDCLLPLCLSAVPACGLHVVIDVVDKAEPRILEPYWHISFAAAEIQAIERQRVSVLPWGAEVLAYTLHRPLFRCAFRTLRLHARCSLQVSK